jgi:hypothetical protein
MNRRQLIVGLAAAASLPSCGLAQGLGTGPWRRRPSVVALFEGEDPRVELVHEAVAFWNHALAEIGSPFRLGPLSTQAGAIAPTELAEVSAAILRLPIAPPFPPALAGVPGDIVVALSDGNFISFTARWPEREKALIGIRSPRIFPLTLPNVARNVIAHELGHAIGLGHNSDPGALMCGRPASCRPDAMASNTARVFPLRDDETARLRALYPPS